MKGEAEIKRLGGSVSDELYWVYRPGNIEGRADTKFNGVLSMRRGGSAVAKYEIRSADEFAVADQSTGLKVFGAAGWGALGAVVAGPVGAIVGGLLGGRGETVTFLAKFGDDTLLGQVPKKTWLKMFADKL